MTSKEVICEYCGSTDFRYEPIFDNQDHITMVCNQCGRTHQMVNDCVHKVTKKFCPLCGNLIYTIDVIPLECYACGWKPSVKNATSYEIVKILLDSVRDRVRKFPKCKYNANTIKYILKRYSQITELPDEYQYMFVHIILPLMDDLESRMTSATLNPGV